MYDTYKEIFSERGSDYDQAMQLFPEARRNEFLSIIEESDLQPGQTVCDIPAGGCYLKNYLDAPVELISVESCLPFLSHTDERQGDRVVVCEPSNTAIQSGSIDQVFSLAGLHHIKDKRDLFVEFARILKPTASFCVADVDENSPVSVFLDSVVDKFCKLGHHGYYFNSQTCEELETAGLQIKNSVLKKYHWQFANEQDLVKFCSLLFSLKVPPDALLKEIDQVLGLEYTKQSVLMNWELRFISGFN